VGDVANWIGTPNHKKLMLILGDGGAIAFNDYAGRNDSTADSIKFIGADGEVLKALSITKLRDMAEDNPVTVNLINNPDVPLRTYRKHDLGAGLNLYGNNDADTIVAGSGDDNVYGNEGGNRLNGRGGNDILFGGNNGDEILLGEDGDDVIFSNNGNDTVIGGHGSDQLYGTGGADLIFGDDSWGFDLPSELLGGDPTTLGQGVTARLEIVNTWWGGFEGRITVTADRSVGEWKLALRSLFSLETVWGAAADQTSAEDARIGTSKVYDYELTNAAWNGSLANGQTTTIGFTARTHIAGAVDARILQTAISVAAAGDELPPVTPIPATGAMDVDQPITVISTWPGGFEGQITVEADQFVTEWKLLLRSEFEIKSFWGAEVALVRSEDGAFLYSLQNTKWNGVLQPDQKITIGFTAKTAGVPTDGEINSATLSLAEDEGLVNQTTAGGGRKLLGGSGSDTFYSSAKKDIFMGAEGKDVFVFGAKLNKTNVDQVTDFNVKADTIYLENDVFTKLGKKGSISKPAQLAKKFFSLDKAKDKDDYIIYSKKKGVLYYDADGSGSKKAVEFAKLDKNLKMTEKDFFAI
jgi:Ca2+-binding RTX toxin-like protein